MNIWKWLFLILIIINIAVAGWLYINLYSDFDDVEQGERGEVPEDELYAVLPNGTVEYLIMNYFADAGEDSIDIDISTDRIELHSQDQVLGMTVNTTFNMDPVLDGQDIKFQISNIDVGELPLSEDMLYSIISGAGDLPSGVHFSEDEHALIVDTGIISEGAGDNISIERIDYQNNEWYFSIER